MNKTRGKELYDPKCAYPCRSWCDLELLAYGNNVGYRASYVIQSAPCRFANCSMATFSSLLQITISLNEQGRVTCAGGKLLHNIITKSPLGYINTPNAIGGEFASQVLPSSFWREWLLHIPWVDAVQHTQGKAYLPRTCCNYPRAAVGVAKATYHSYLSKFMKTVS